MSHSDKKNVFVDFYSSWVDFNVKMIKNSMELTTEAWEPESYEKFYRSWSENMGDLIEKMFRMPGFAKHSWEFFKSTTGFQKNFNEMIEMYLKAMKIPTHKEVDELSERINYLDDKLEEIEKKLDLLLDQKKLGNKSTCKSKTNAKKKKSDP